jgi:hypothetical protein
MVAVGRRKVAGRMGCRPTEVGGCNQVVGRRRVGPRNGMSALSPDGIYVG